MRIDIYIINPDNGREMDANIWILQSRSEAVKGMWLVIRADGLPPFMIHKNNLYDRCATADFFDCVKTSSHSGCRLGKEAEWWAVHEAKMHSGLDRILTAIEGDVIDSKLSYTEEGSVVRSFSRDGYMETFERAKLTGRTEIFARNFKSVAK